MLEHLSQKEYAIVGSGAEQSVYATRLLLQLEKFGISTLCLEQTGRNQVSLRKLRIVGYPLGGNACAYPLGIDASRIQDSKKATPTRHGLGKSYYSIR